MKVPDEGKLETLLPEVTPLGKLSARGEDMHHDYYYPTLLLAYYIYMHSNLSPQHKIMVLKFFLFFTLLTMTPLQDP